MRVKDGPDGLYMCIVTRRVGRGRGCEGFGNACSVYNAFVCIIELKKSTDDLLLTKEDLLGPDPCTVLKKNVTWDNLCILIGLSLFDIVSFNYQRELEEKPMMEFLLNKIFVRNPDTGKTTVVKLYGKLLAEIRYLLNREGNFPPAACLFIAIESLIVKNLSDFIGNVIGGSEATIKGILASTLSKVLVIDKVYILGGMSLSSDGGTNPDIFKTAVIDTLVVEV
ncbi:uncharacterized protein BO88DRAFT_429616 [Aspergillus vadensis CBS 113365]|uniref:Uncharacterized protein n=1 Tax=Aspergillus vadensis (strain CBS 113365 / IMI 142717 / IBT 24658) TaxID=1448311 RepID=A0A319AW19_ASPVC|nr:hypothetical protein BO88DRAFT_429616 [Aspergillus vadensis CBS 113365]PYH64566.1 hypothetical protein BO88DRAFT_429616 [Aspergillus vadensis CBS 113365]